MLPGIKVNLRAPERRDLERYQLWLSDPVVNRFLIVRGPLSMGDEERWLEETLRNPSNRVFAVETKEGALIGNVGLHGIDKPDREATLGIFIGDKDFWSRGFGADTIVTLLRWGFDEINLHCISLVVREDNARAIRCYEKCGFQHEGRLRARVFREGRYWDHLSMSILRDEFVALHH